MVDESFTSHEAIAQAIINAYLPHPKLYSPKSQKHTRSLPRSLTYLLREQRLLFIFVGVLIGSIFFLLQPSVSPLSSATPSADQPPRIFSANRESSVRYQDPNYEHHLGTRNNYRYASGVGRVPVGIGRKRNRIVVTGGAGFVGSHLVDKLIARGDDVIVVDNFFTGRKDNLVHLFGNPRFELIRHDVVEPILLEVDQIYHLACPASPVHYKYNPVKTIISFFSVFTALNLS
ncbi:UNVERIFIED_CONTAM: UDP-glucuronic acid decarboxylase 1 [Sesamum latifolium]|uniref:UDP-glucuronate decarboxylase n=1 Tax=Sesamum latifolium TaxID=2727402 RepID=A0AAW2TZY7_9LAMI